MHFMDTYTILCSYNATDAKAARSRHAQQLMIHVEYMKYPCIVS